MARFEQDCTDKADDGILVGEDADHLGPSFDLAIETFDRVGGVQLGAMGRRNAHIGQNVDFGFVEVGRQLGQLRPQLVGDTAPLFAGGVGVILRKRRADEGRNDAAPALPGMGKNIAHEVDTAALPGVVQHLGNGGLDAFVGVGDHQLDAAQATAGELAQERGPERLGLGGADIKPRESRAVRRC